MSRKFLFLQGPLSFFFYRLAKALRAKGCGVVRVQLCGGDEVFWPDFDALCYRGRSLSWPKWIADCMRIHKVTDLLLIGDWRPMHNEAVLLAKARGIRIWVFEEGYLRPGFITLEEGGVNA
ncbi:MAG: capsular biosynthesis protein, partial [Desulfovibrio sp.]|nr:capsular biosynthesis protein [Desulfovibrio sp.]